MGELLIEIGSWFIAIGVTIGLFICLLWVLAKVCELFMGGSK
jgi:hypothetical protein